MPLRIGLGEYGPDVVASDLIQKRVLHQNREHCEVSYDVAQDGKEHVHHAVLKLGGKG